MSESRIPDLAFRRTIAREEGKIKSEFEFTRFEIYNAGQFRMRLDGKKFSRKIPARRSMRKDFFKNMFRLRINGRWYNPSGSKYTFFTMDEISNLLFKDFCNE